MLSFHVKFMQTDSRTEVKLDLYATDLSMRKHKMFSDTSFFKKSIHVYYLNGERNW